MGFDYSYRTGYVPFRAYQKDKRFSYCLYVPEKLKKKPTIIVPVHSTDRNAESLRNEFADLAERRGAIVCSPLFSVGISTKSDLDDYKFLNGHRIRYDKILWGMIDEVCKDYALKNISLVLYGFSGGAQFVHRFVMLYPEMIRAAAIAAPGLITLPSKTLPWWAGCKNVAPSFGKEVDWRKIRRIKIQMLVGSLDLDQEEIALTKDDPLWVEGADRATGTRIDRLKALRDSWRKQGVSVVWKEVEGVNHDDAKLLPIAKSFLEKYLGD